MRRDRLKRAQEEQVALESLLQSEAVKNAPADEVRQQLLTEVFKLQERITMYVQSGARADRSDLFVANILAVRAETEQLAREGTIFGVSINKIFDLSNGACFFFFFFSFFFIIAA